MTFEYIPYEKCFKSLRKYSSNPLEKSPGDLEMTIEDIPYKNALNP